MPPERRSVRVTEGFFQQLDAHLGSDRGADGQPSATDFLVFELPAIVERFAIDFEDLPLIVDGVPAGRMLLVAGLLVYAVAVYGVLLDDGSVDLVGVTIELG